MLKRTDLEGVKGVARLLLMTKIHKTEFSPVVVQHPFTANGIVGISIDGKVRLLDITENEDDLNIWRNYELKCIDTAENAFYIYDDECSVCIDFSQICEKIFIAKGFFFHFGFSLDQG